MSGKSRGELLRLTAIIGWAAVFFLWLQFDLWYLFAAYFAIHLLEACTIGLKRGRAAGYTILDSFTYTFVFAFTWWYYLPHKN